MKTFHFTYLDFLQLHGASLIAGVAIAVAVAVIICNVATRCDY